MATISQAEKALFAQIGWFKLELPTQQYKFCAKRKWTADFAWVEKRIILEIEGGIWTQGRHVRGAGFEKDCEKYNWATAHGWKVFRVPSDCVKSGEAIALVEEVLKAHN